MDFIQPTPLPYRVVRFDLEKEKGLVIPTQNKLQRKE